MDRKDNSQIESPQPITDNEFKPVVLNVIHTQSEQTALAQQQDIVDVVDRSNMARYLKSLSQSCNSEALVTKVNSKVIEKARLSLERGMLEISLNPPPMPKKPYNYKTAQQEEKEMQAKAKREQLNRKLRFLDEQIRCGTKGHNNQKGLQVEVKDVLTKQQHENRVKQLAQGWVKRQRRQKQIHDQGNIKIHEAEIHQQKLRQLEQQKQAQSKRGIIQSKIQQRKKQHEQFISQQAKLDQELLEAKQKDCLHVKMEQRYVSQVVIPSLEEYKNKLKQIRSLNNKFDSTLINQHEKQYLSARISPRSGIKAENSLETKWQPPPRTAKLTKLLQQQKNQQKQKLLQRKKRCDEHTRREQNFISELKSKVKLTVDPAKKQEIERRLIEEHKKKERPVIDGKRLGEAYLEMARKFIKPEHLRNSQEKSKTTEEDKNISQLKHFLPPRNRSPQFFEHHRKRKMEGILNSECSISEKVHLIQIETDKLQQKIRQQQMLNRLKGQDQETGDLLLCSIQAKIGLIQLLRPDQ